MRVNVYTEELPTGPRPMCEIVTAEYTSSRTGKRTENFGLRIFLKSAPELHDTPKDDDRSAVTFWCGPNREMVRLFLLALLNDAALSNVDDFEPGDPALRNTDWVNGVGG